MSSSTKYRIDEVYAQTEPIPTFVSNTSCMSSCQQVGSKVYVVGTLGREFLRGTTVGVYDLKENTWEWVVDDDRYAPFTNGHASFVVDDRMYVHGGFISPGKFDTKLYYLDLVTLAWNTCENSVFPPGGRIWHVGEYLERLRKFVCYGGQTRIGQSDQVWTLSIDSLQWKLADVKGSKPMKLYGHSSCAVGEQIYFIGGRHSHIFAEGITLLDCRRSTFVWSNPSVSLGFCRCFASLSYVNGEFLVFGGFNNSLVVSEEIFVFSAPDFKPIKSEFPKRENVEYRSFGHTAIVTSTGIYILDGSRNTFNPLKLLAAAQSN